MFANLLDNGSPFQTIRKRVVYRGASSAVTTLAAVNQVLALDTTLVGLGETTTTTGGYNPTPGTSTGTSVTATAGPGGGLLQPIDLIYTSAITPLAASATVGQIYCVVTDLLDGGGALGSTIEVCLQGRVVVKTASAAYTLGQILMMSSTVANRELVAHAVSTNAGQRPLAIVESGAGTVTSLTVQFFGFAGILSQAAIAN